MPDRANQHPGIFRWLTVGLAAYLGWIVVNIVFLIFLPLLLLVELLGGAKGRRFFRRIGVGFLRIFFLGYFQMIRVYRAEELPDPERLRAIGPCVFVSNHRSWIDALLLIALIPGVRIPVNIEYTRAPMARQMMRWLGCIPLDRKSRESLVQGCAEIERILQSGGQVAVFPEGTRSSIGKLRLFSDVFFRIAAKERVPVMPILTHLEHPFLGPGSENFLTARCAALKILVLEPVEPKEGERGSDLGRRTWKLMSERLTELDAGEADSQRGNEGDE
ncbi:MAG: 1-acyl-sn-glycerol-3-phosphate acyltransferase [Deltaproteobacteria bacterium]|nr:1-acyl-sn-glycerol-3-phosphate acyltransferase [Deltaproteobacteria bacterium]